METVPHDVSESMQSAMCVDGSMSERGLTLIPVDIDIEPHISDENNIGDNSVEGDLDSWEGEAIREPYVGMEFKSEGDARAFYNAYARRVGFGTRVRYSHRSDRDKQIVVQRYVCSKEGFRQNTEGTRKRDRAITRVGCNASMTVRKVNPGTWVVKSFEREHNHPLVSPTQVQFLRSHKGKSCAVKNLSRNANRSLMGSCNDVMMGLNGQSSGVANADLIERHFVSHLPTLRRRNLNAGDTQTILEYFKHMQSENPSFFYAAQVDKEDHMTNFFWADATSKMAYKYFGDVITFDTTYLTNKYRMPFAPIVGVNHHNQSALFGCALLADDTKSSYVWLFKTWLKAMGGRHPISIITDQDRAIQAAVAEVFPNTRHRFCMWHIQRKLLEKLGQVVRTHKNFKDEFQKCIYQTKTIEEFESSWGLLLDTFDLRGNQWLQLLYEDRQHWVPVYLKGTFFAEMSTTQRSYAFFDGFVNVNTSPEEFFRQYDNALDSRYYKEVRAEFDTMYTTPNLKTSSPMEKNAAAIYTREIFKKFQIELFECFGYIADKISENVGGMETYFVSKFGEVDKDTVTFNESEMRGSCSCQKFEFAGILCRHLLSVFKVTNVFDLPSHFVLKRWTRNAKSRDVSDERLVEAKGNCRQSMIMRYNDLCHRSIAFAEEGAKSVENYNVAVRALQGALEEVVNLNDSVPGKAANGNPGQSDQSTPTPTAQSSRQDDQNRS
ncbi:protein FAR1-RELATED SEQUENCE 5-like [Aristolochia californica]|uniref:protein FAR1-RELATED SEQUENCE 5-like n=1 Tax=Aristolochia californica TaxID=171875 RepID=UPI0035E09BE1